MVTKRFLNVQYGAIATRINVTDMKNIRDVITAITNYYKGGISSSAGIQLWKKTASENNLIQDLVDIPEDYYLTPSNGGLSLAIVLPPSPQQVTEIDVKQEDIQTQVRKVQGIEISDLTTQLQTFANVQLVDECLQSSNDIYLPYPQNKFKNIYVRKCYKDIFDFLLKNIEMKSFAISGTSGIGKSLFFVYILHRLMNDFYTKTLSLKPNRIIYQMNSTYLCYDLHQQIVSVVTDMEAGPAVRQQDTFYIIDGQFSEPLASSCVVLFISSSRSEGYKVFVKQKTAKECFFPVWTLAELQTCQRYCYPELSVKMLKERYRICGGVARLVFDDDDSM
ncbi:hypothetical protein BC833DRAFT_543306, partial [Globomyces pollinis-pini]